MLKSKKAFSFIEVILIIIAISIVLLAISPLMTSGVRFFESATSQTRLQEQVTLAAEHIARRASTASSITWTAATPSQVTINYAAPGGTTTVSYRHDAVNNTIIFIDENLNQSVIAENITTLQFTGQNELIEDSDEYSRTGIEITSAEGQQIPVAINTTARARAPKVIVSEPVFNLTAETFHATIGDAIDEAASGNNILISAGTYDEDVTMEDGVSIWGGYEQGFEDVLSTPGYVPDPNPDNDNYRDPETYETIIDGWINCYNLYTSQVTISGFTVLTITCEKHCDVKILYNKIRGAGGIRCSQDCTVEIIGNEISGNTKSDGGGIYAVDCALTIIDNEITGNTAHDRGGGIYLATCDSFEIIDNEITGNEAGSGGGINIYQSTHPIENYTISNNLIEGNTATGGGGITFRAKNNVSVSNNRIIGNAADYAGGVFCDVQSCPTISGGEISGNTSFSAGSAISCSNETDVTVENCTIENNEVTYKSGNYSGSVVSCVDESSLVMRNCIIRGNTVNVSAGYKRHGAIIYFYCIESGNSNKLTLESCLLANNTIIVTTHSGTTTVGGICIKQYNSYQVSSITNCTIVDNIVTLDGVACGAIYKHGMNPTIKNLILHNNGGDDLYDCSATYSWIQTDEDRTGTGNIGPADSPDGTPMFTGARYRLQPTSPCIDAGDPTEKDPDGSTRDMGYLFAGAAARYVYMTTAYTTQRLQILDVSDPVNPVEAGHCSVFGWHIDVNGAYAYLTRTSGGHLRIINISNPANPVEVGSLTSLAGIGTDIHVQGNYAYMTQMEDGFYIIDVSNPTNPTEVGHTAFDVTDGMLTGVRVRGNYAYVICRRYGLRVVDISDPSAPSEVGSSAVIGRALDIYIQDNHAYIATNWFKGGGLTIMDITDPSNPFEAGSLSFATYGSHPAPSSVYVLGDYAYVPHSNSAGLRVVDISDPSNPTEVGNLGGYYVLYKIYIRGNYAYITSRSGDKLYIIDISDPFNPTKIGQYDAPDGTYGIYAD